MCWLWATADHSEGIVLHAEVPPARVVFFDGGFQPELWGRSYILEPGVDQLAAAEFAGTARASVVTADGMGAKALAVIGDGVLAQLIRRIAAGRAAGVDVLLDSDVVIDTTGSPSRIARTVQTLPRLGCLVLAAPSRVGQMELATYGDVHVRGLRIVGVPWASGSVVHVDDKEPQNIVLRSMARTSPGRLCQRAPLYVLEPGG